LSSQLTGLVVGVSEDIIVPTNELLAGDINGNAFVEINDITGIIGNFGKGAPQAWSGDPTVGAGTGVISGVTQPQFMSDSSFVELTLTGIGVSQTTMADAAGNWAFPAVPAGEYTLKASALSHISAERTSVVLGSDENLEIPSNVLLAGDINGNNFIEINDITGTIGNFGKGAPQPWPVP
ncbi:MAG: carboxypeptidase regulatory-like domain-containing protein, partial [Chloroflexi bacterium]|nr:carboxypeptidase regulatory-like domain-containing protein [Chloroflexota bacterium]